MGFLNWFLAKPAARPPASTQTDIHATLADATRPLMPSSAKSGAQPAPAGTSAQRLEQRRNERNARRELLFQVVRESMVRVGVLSSAFKFKVLALDQRGQTFLVMIDLSAEFAGETDKLSEIEALISQAAKTRFELIVQAVYWRFYDTVMSNAMSRQGATSNPVPFGLTTNSRPVPLSAQPFPVIPKPAAPYEPFPATVKLPGAPSKPDSDPLEHGEVEAFKRALASGAQPGLSIPLGGATPSYTSTQAFPARATSAPATPPKSAPTPATAPTSAPPVASATTAKPVPKPVAKAAPVPNPSVLATAANAAKAASLAAINNKLLLTGYEDTEMPDPDAPVLSATQYGELR
jgi:hypothetical protein